ncbi:MAG: DUF805 domain-containing protein [Chlamydiia bacterium]|nr:DUF805 domain-containing protein [Chlamydiia bacterium]
MKLVYEALTKNYANFSARACRKEYWLYTLSVYLFQTAGSLFKAFLPLQIFFGLCSLLLIIPRLAVAFRRLHDIGRSGWNLLFIFLPVIGWIVLIVFYCKKGESGINKYGPNPLSNEIVTA